MNKVAKFYKVSFEQFMKDYKSTFLDKDKDLTSEEIIDIRKIYDDIKLPKRATVGSAGYDFSTPIAFTIMSGETIKIPTGIRVRIESDWVLMLFPRSSLGFKYRAQLDNSVGIIDSDYFCSDNEGHIFAKLTNDSKDEKILTLKAGDTFMQGIFLQYGLTDDDDTKGVRNGGFGSTGR